MFGVFTAMVTTTAKATAADIPNKLSVGFASRSIVKTVRSRLPLSI